MTMSMKMIIHLERLILNFSRTWGNFTPAEKDEIAEEIAREINKLNKYQRSELWRRIHRCHNILSYIAKYLQT